MTRRPYTEISKSLVDRTLELISALLVVSDCLGAVRQGRGHHVVPLFGQLRALLTDRTTEPLLFAVASALEQPLEVFSMPSVDRNGIAEILGDKLELQFGGFPVSIVRELPAQEHSTLKELLDKKIIQYKSTYYTTRELIDWFANKAGGAHYSNRVPGDFADLVRIQVFEQSAPVHFFCQLAEVTLAAGRALLKRLSDVEFHITLAIPPQRVAKPAHIFDVKHPHTPMRISLFLTQMRGLHLLVTGLDGKSGQAGTVRLLDWAKMQHVVVVVRLEEDLTTMLELHHDGERVAKARTSTPLFVLANLIESSIHWNSDAEGVPQPIRFGLGTHFIAALDAEPWQRAEVYLRARYECSPEQNPLCSYFDRGAYGHTAAGTNVINMCGARHMSAAEVLKIRDTEGESDPL